MSWKTINGRRYFYRSVREGRRVRTTYVGTEETASLRAFFDGVERSQREADRRRLRAERQQSAEEKRAVRVWFDGIEAVAEAAIVACGFRKHKGQWRRKRKQTMSNDAMRVEFPADDEAACKVIERALRGERVASPS